MTGPSVSLELFRELVLEHRKKAEACAELRNGYEKEAGKWPFQPNDMHRKQYEKDAARLEGKRQAYQNAADDLEKLLKELE